MCMCVCEFNFRLFLLFLSLVESKFRTFDKRKATVHIRDGETWTYHFVLYYKFPVCLQGFCPGLTHGQKFGISYQVSTYTTHETEPTTTDQSSNHDSGSHHNSSQELSKVGVSKSVPPKEWWRPLYQWLNLFKLLRMLQWIPRPLERKKKKIAATSFHCKAIDTKDEKLKGLTWQTCSGCNTIEGLGLSCWVYCPETWTLPHS